MRSLADYFQLLLAGPADPPIAIDRCHNLLLFGALTSHKPQRVLEVGIGTGFTTWCLIHGLRFNGRGRLTCVDNWHDWAGREPPCVQAIRDAGVEVIAPMDERQFLARCPSGEFDFIVSDADHSHADQFVDEYIRIASPDGMLFFHDTNNGMFPNLRRMKAKVRELGFAHFEFSANSRQERADRGLLMVIRP